MPEITIGRLRGGYCVSWRENGRRRRYQLKARTRSEAESEARDRYLKEAGGGPDNLSVGDIWHRYCQHLGNKPTAATMGWTGKAVLPALGHLRPDQITDRDCRNYVFGRIDAGRAVGTAHTELGHLRSALRWAARRGLIDQVPHIEMPPKPDSDGAAAIR